MNLDVSKPNTSTDEFIPNWEDYLVRQRTTWSDRCSWKHKGTSSASVDDYEILNKIGIGGFGNVFLARNKSNGKINALKVLEKENIVKQAMILQAMNECRFLIVTNFPFIVHMEQYFVNNSYVFFVLPFIPGGDLYHHLKISGPLSEHLSAFYASQVILALEYFHNLRIVYRDLKPHNILIDVDGYIKLTDLGFCKVVTKRTYTICGTAEYMAPEVILCKGYGMSVDWWSLGVLIYEMCSGVSPFFANDMIKVYNHIVNCEFAIVKSFSSSLKSLVKSLLQLDTSKRLGCTYGGARTVKEHRWFKGTDWLAVLNKRVVPDYIPTLSSPLDTQYFKSYHLQPLNMHSQNLYHDEFKDFLEE